MMMSDYSLSLYKDPLAAFLALPTEAISQLYLTGVGNRSYFDARAIYFLSLSGNQSQVPVVAPVIDYSNVINHSVLGGELSYKGNFTSLTRDTAAFDAVTAAALANGSCLATGADPAKNITPANCLLRGMPGTYTRATGEVDWRRSFTDSAGEIWTPFASVRVDAIDASVANQPGVSNFLADRRKPGAAGDAHGRPRISLPLHQCSAVGNHDDRTDRAGHRSSQRTLCRQASQRRRAEHDLRHHQPVQRRQILRLRSRGRRWPRQCRRADDDAVRPRRLGHRGVRTVLSAVRLEFLCGARRHQYRAGLRSGQAGIGLCRQHQLFAQQDLHLQHARAIRRGDRERRALRG